jgi:pyruvate dehydrogenase E2 component (dihydrolipoamide acetyltransferase)
VSDQGGASVGAERARGSVQVVELSQAQAAFARRGAESKATAPHVYFERAIDASTGLARLVAACARALRDVPLLNGAYRDGHVERYSRVNVAFGLEMSGTLVLPVVHDADVKDQEAIAREIEELSEQARGGTLTSPALAGATFTVIEMPVERFTPVITRGQAATLGAGTEWLSLACDNRIVQGSEGATFLTRITEALTP